MNIELVLLFISHTDNFCIIAPKSGAHEMPWNLALNVYIVSWRSGMKKVSQFFLRNNWEVINTRL